MDTKIAARMIAVFAIGAGLTAAITALQNDEDRPDANAPRIDRPGGDPSSLSAAKSELGRCRKAWAESRRRFFRMDKPDKPTPPKQNTVEGETR